MAARSSLSLHVIPMGIPFYTAYSATKAAMRSFSMTWAADLKERGIRVNTLSPGATVTPIIDGQFKNKEESDAAKASPSLFARMRNRTSGGVGGR
jgi:NAD(P)-dependent dehydrogenase (short-subunit alcohol dehydrogenase family)